MSVGEEAGAEPLDPAYREAARVEASGGALFDTLHHGSQPDYLSRMPHTETVCHTAWWRRQRRWVNAVKRDDGQTTALGLNDKK